MRSALDGVANVPGHDNDINLAISSLIAAPATEQCSVGGAAQGRVAKACAKHQSSDIRQRPSTNAELPIEGCDD